MNIEKMITDSKNKFDQSPIREIIRNNKSFPVKLQVENIETIDKLYYEMELQEEKIRRPLNIVLMGEVKSGKSTFLNAFVGDNVSPANVLEATAVITEVEYGHSESSMILYKNGEIKKGSIDEIYKIINEKQTDINFSQNIEKIKVIKESNNCKYFNIVDTPGLLTITDENVNTTKKYLMWADLILWVLDANYLGQSDIISELEEIEEYGKPIIGLLNKIDLIKGKEEVIKYANREYKFYFDRIFPISGLKAYNAVMNNNMELLKESGFDSLIEYIKNNISSSKKSEEIKIDSIIKTIESINRRDKYCHEIAYNEVKEVAETFNDINEHLDYYVERINNKIETMVKSKVMSEFLSDEANNVLSYIDSNSLSKEQMNQLEHMISQFGSEQCIKEYLQVLQVEVNKVTTEEWKSAIKILESKIQEKLQKFIEAENRFKERINNELYDSTDIITYNEFNPANNYGSDTVAGIDKDDLKEGLLVSGGVGAALAVYASALGPAAAYVSFGTALSAIIPPVVIAGVVIVGIKSVFGKNKQKKEIRDSLYTSVNTARAKFNSEIVDRYLIPKVIEDNKEYKKKLINTYSKSVFNSDIHDVISFGEKLENYLNLN